MKFPNGFGNITKLSGSRRRPFAVRKTFHGHQKYLAYFSSLSNALAYLVDINKAPNILGSDITFGDAYHFEMAERRKRISIVTAKNYDISFNYCSSITNKRLIDLTVSDLQSIIKSMSSRDIGHPSQKKARQVMHNVYRYAVKYQLLSSTADISRFVDIDPPHRKYKKRPFNTRQLNRVKAIADDYNNSLRRWAMCVVMMCYSGPRPSEFIHILKSDVKLKQRIFRIRDSKTAAGRNRIVPISRKTLPYYKYWMNHNGATLISDDAGNMLTYHKFLKLFKDVMKASNCNHRPHECRHTCATWLDAKGANKLATKRILGHAVQDITDGVYTHPSIRQLRRAIDLL
jgi:site-specific recombinase XerD